MPKIASGNFLKKNDNFWQFFWHSIGSFTESQVRYYIVMTTSTHQLELSESKQSMLVWKGLLELSSENIIVHSSSFFVFLLTLLLLLDPSRDDSLLELELENECLRKDDDSSERFDIDTLVVELAGCFLDIDDWDVNWLNWLGRWSWWSLLDFFPIPREEWSDKRSEEKLGSFLDLELMSFRDIENCEDMNEEEEEKFDVKMWEGEDDSDVMEIDFCFDFAESNGPREAEASSFVLVLELVSPLDLEVNKECLCVSSFKEISLLESCLVESEDCLDASSFKHMPARPESKHKPVPCRRDKTDTLDDIPVSSFLLQSLTLTHRSGSTFTSISASLTSALILVFSVRAFSISFSVEKGRRVTLPDCGSRMLTLLQQQEATSRTLSLDNVTDVGFHRNSDVSLSLDMARRLSTSSSRQNGWGVLGNWETEKC